MRHRNYETTHLAGILMSPWHDLVYHALSHLRVPADDASSLHSDAYSTWCREHLEAAGLRSGAVPRTLLLDAPLLGELYARSPQGFLLHAWPLLWDGIPGFLAEAGRDLAELSWPTPGRAALAAAIQENTAPPLPELFRTALWSELANGYEDAWRQVVAPRGDAYRGEFLGILGELAQCLPELHSFEWVLCHPLRRHGRLLECPGERSLVVVGVADAELGVPSMHPVLQGCHEAFVRRARLASPGEAPWATVPGRPGHGAFAAVERAALGMGARFFLGSPWEGAYLDWLGFFFPGKAPAEAAARLAAGT